MQTTLQAAGRNLMQLREKAELTQQQLEAKTAELEERHEGKRVYAQQISRIEKGQIDKPPILDLLSIGRVLRMSTAQVLSMYGLWYEQPVREQHPAFRTAQEVFEQLDAEDQDEFISWLQFETEQMRARRARRQRVIDAVQATRAKAKVPTPVEAVMR